MNFELLTNEPLSNYTTLQIGGVADYVAIVKSKEELQAALQFAKKQTATPPLILSGGSNVLCSDAGYRGMVIVNRLNGYEILKQNHDTILLSVGAGEVLDEIILKTISDEFWGLENLSAIPGSIGATPIQNVGAYGVEISDVVQTVTAVHSSTGETRVFTQSECKFSYRHSFFKTPAGKNWCVTSVQYQLHTKPRPILSYKDMQSLQTASKPTQQQIRDHVVSIRQQKFPDWRTVGTAGSFFKNPIISNEQLRDLVKRYPDVPYFPVDAEMSKVSLGWILDKICNLKGFRHGPVHLFEKQALVLVAESGATASDVEEFAKIITEKVFALTDIQIEREVLSV